MRLTDLNGNKVWLNPLRVDSVQQALVNIDGSPHPGVRIVTPNATFTTQDSFEELTKQLDEARQKRN